MSSPYYINIIDKVIPPPLLDEHLKDVFYFLQQDLSLVQTACIVTEHLEVLHEMTLAWLPQGADLHIIENVVSITKARLSKKGAQNTYCDELWECVQVEWEMVKTVSSLVTSLYNSLPRRIANVVEFAGHFNRY